MARQAASRRTPKETGNPPGFLQAACSINPASRITGAWQSSQMEGPFLRRTSRGPWCLRGPSSITSHVQQTGSHKVIVLQSGRHICLAIGVLTYL